MEDEYREYEFTVTGKVYATSHSHASHFVYWSLEEALNYSDASHASIRLESRLVEEDTAQTTPAPKPATEHIALQN